METQEIISLLRQGTKNWNLWRESVERSALTVLKSTPVNVPSRDIIWEKHFRELIEVDLKGANLEGIELRGAMLGAYRSLLHVLIERGLSSGDLPEFKAGAADLCNADLSKADLRGADLHLAELRGTNFDQTDLRNADLSQAILDDAHLVGAKLEEANLEGASLRNAKLGYPWGRVLKIVPERREREQRPVEVYEAHLAGARLVGADLSGARLSRLNLRNIDFSKAKCLTKAQFAGADLSGATLTGADLREACFNGADLTGADLSGATMNIADLSSLASSRVLGSRSVLYQQALDAADLGGAILNWADLSGVDLSWMDLRTTMLSGATLRKAHLVGTDLTKKNLSGAKLEEADLSYSILVETDLTKAHLDGCRIYGVSVWNIRTDHETTQKDLIITRADESDITVDDIKVAQFIYLLLNNEEVRGVIDAITSKAVLILGRFSPERKIILDRLREELRTKHYLPILFDFEKPKSRDTIETIRTLAGMSKFIIADLTDAKAVVQELQAIVPNLPSVAVRFIIQKSEREPGMFDHIRRFPWVLDGAFEYENSEEVIESINDNILKPVEAKLKELSF